MEKSEWSQLPLEPTGFEGGKVLKDEEYRGECRITLERCPDCDAITCGVYGDMVHTAFAHPGESQEKYEDMKRDLQDFIDRDVEDLHERSAFYRQFTEKYL